MQTRRNLLFSLVVAVITFIVFMCFYTIGNWWHIAVPGLKPEFADLLFILAGSDCKAMGIDVVVENPCDPWGRTHNYGLLWLEVGRFGLTMDDITWLGFTVNIIFLIAASWTISPNSVKQVFITILFLISPAIMLGLERANADLILFTLLALALHLLNSNNVTNIVVACILVFTASVLKLYPLVVLPVLALYYSSNRSKFLLIVTSLLSFFVYLLFNWAEVFHLVNIIPNITWIYSMGGELLFSRLGYELNSLTRLITWCFAFLVIVFGTIWACRTQRIENLAAVDFKPMLYLVGATLVVFSFVVRNSFDYRNVYVLFLLPFLFTLISDSKIKTQYKSMSIIIIIVYGFLLWAEFFVSVFNNIQSSGFYIRILETILNWLILVPIIMLAVKIVIENSRRSRLMRILLSPLERIII